MAASLVATAALVAGPAGVDAAGVSFRDDVQPIFDAKCAICHPTSFDYLDLRRGRSYDELVRVNAVLQPAFYRVLPGRPELSYLLTHVPDPSREGLLTDEDEVLIARWIREGARRN